MRVQNANGHLAAQTWPQGLQVTFAPNALGQPTQAGTFASGVQYYPNGAVQQFVYGNGIVHQMQQNARQLPARSTDTGTLDLLTSFDVNGNVSAINDLVQVSGFDRQMQYDANDRLTAAYLPAFGGDGWYRFGYDALDNLRTWTQPGEGQRRYDYDGSNRLVVIRNAGGAAIMGFAYDVQGNLSLKNGQGYQFDYGNRLRQATNLERYRYDGHGRRSSVIDAGSGQNRHYLYSQGGALAYLWDQGTGEYTQYIQLAGSLVATRKVDAGGAAVVRYQHTDALGSPVAETNEQAVVVQRTAYTPYGASIGAQKDGVGYTGHVMDGSTGLTYMQQRYMDPGVGAFLSVDPVTAHSQPIGSFHRYRYGNSNPYKFTDPDGRNASAALPLLVIPMIVVTTVATLPSETRKELVDKIGDAFNKVFQKSEPVDEGPALQGDGSLAPDQKPVQSPVDRPRTPAPFLPDDPYSPESTSGRQSQTRETEGSKNRDPDSAIPDRGAGSDQGGHAARGRTPHETGERNVNKNEEHSRRAKGNPSGRMR